jgi:hypothetical protein
MLNLLSAKNMPRQPIPPFRLPTKGFCVLCNMTDMSSELVKQLLDAGFPAAKPGRDNELLGIPTLEELIAAVEQIHAGFRLSVKRINPDTNGKRNSGSISIDGEVAYWARHGSTATEALAKLWLALHAV